MIPSNYRALYDRIAHDHVSHWKRTGRNPFQDPTALKANEDATVRLIPGGSLLDVGCGMGDLLMRFPDRERHGIDISEEYLQIARDRGLSVSLASAEHIPFPDNSFDVVVATDILEHVFDLNRVARELVRVARRYVVVRVPNMENVAWDESYGLVHVRILFGLILGCAVLKCYVSSSEIHLLASVR